MSDELKVFGDDFGKLLIEDAKQRALKESVSRAGNVVTEVMANITNDKRTIAICTKRVALNEKRLKAIEQSKFSLVTDDYTDPRNLGRQVGVIRYDDEELN